MGKTYRTANGKTVDIDNIRLTNENTIAVGNMKVNARGDLLGPGGTVVQTRNQAMDKHYRIHSPVVTNRTEEIAKTQSKSGARTVQGTVKTAPVIPADVDSDGVPFDPPVTTTATTTTTPTSQPATQQLRGSLADSIIKDTLPQTGPKRI